MTAVNPEAYVEMATTESRHWWFRARRKILEHIIGTMGLPRPARILEVGSGTGGNLAMLSQHGSVSAIEMDENARKLSSEKPMADSPYVPATAQTTYLSRASSSISSACSTCSNTLMRMWRRLPLSENTSRRADEC